MKTIELSNDTYDRLAQHATGFESPECVINRILDIIEVEPGQKPSLSFYPEDEEEFKKQLIEMRRAHVSLRFADGSEELGIWNVRAFNQGSNLRANLWSGYLRGWKERGIISASFRIDTKSTDSGPTRILSSANYNQYVINRYEGGTILIFEDGREVAPAKPVLRVIAKELNLSTENSSGNEMNTRQLGDTLIKAINPR